MSPRPLELGLYTDSLPHLGFEAVLDIAALVIENEDAGLTPEAAVREAARFTRSVLDG